MAGRGPEAARSEDRDRGRGRGGARTSPAWRRAAGARRGGRRGGSSRGMTMATILVIGAERVPGDRLRATLGREGHDVIVATSGRDGLERFRQHRPHVTLLDRHLPDLDGIEVLKAIRAREPQAAVILLTGGGTETPEDQARALGVTDCVSTGLSVEVLAGAVARVLPRPAAPGPPLQ